MRDDIDHDHALTEEAGARGWRGRLARRVSVWAGALAALGVVGGLGLWGYALSQRDASEVPVLRAALGPAKVQPDDPGGAKIAYQEITAFRAGAGGPVPSDIVFAPPPERPSPEDLAMAALGGEGETPGQGTGEATGQATGQGTGQGTGEATGEATGGGPAEASAG
ncbi:MAG TPA: hypothetical protein VMM59_00790, partial [Thermohalobaculum sp.]|nr:hypothetical protein [Thermohalobaculum sp.]